MRTLAFAAAAALTLASAAFAQSPVVSVTIAPELQAAAEQTYGVRDVQRLADELQRVSERALARSGRLADGGRLELVLVDVKPNRPTFTQLNQTPSLSFQSFGVGGATIEGRAVAADGTVTELHYRWYETDIRQAPNSAIWSDAEWAIDRFAGRLGRGEAMALR